MRITIHQPNYLPWLGYFVKMAQGDKHILLDNVEYSKNSWVNRNRIRNEEGWQYLTIPIPREFHGARIRDVKLPDSGKWKKQHRKAIEANYGRAQHFRSHSDFFQKLYEREFNYLTEINEEVISYLLRSFEINVEIVKASELNIDSSLKGSDLLIEIAKKVGATTYISGPSGRTYLQLEEFKGAGIAVEFFSFIAKPYRQAFPGFVPGMASIDALFNLGIAAKDLIR
ncbi:MAG: WbqC family protein [Thermoplasmata archaeon]